jgi:hypothetical protein
MKKGSLHLLLLNQAQKRSCKIVAGSLNFGPK